MTWLAASVLAVNLVVWGAHALVPWRFAAASEAKRRHWALVALPAAGLSIVVTAAGLRFAPDAAVAWHLHELDAGVLPTLLLALALAGAILGDLILAFGWRGFEPVAWRVLAVLGALALAAVTFASELVRIGWGPVPATWALVAAAALRLALALAAAEATIGPPTLVTPAAGFGLAAAVFLWPASLVAGLGADRLTLYSAVLLLLLARFVPARLRRPAAIAGLVLATLFLVRAGQVSEGLGVREVLPADSLSP